MRREIDWDFYFITDSSLTRQDYLKDSEDAIRGGAKVVQYREKGRQVGELEAEARRLLAICREAEVDFVVNDSPELAAAIGADGVHIGPKDVPLSRARMVFPNGIIGVSCGSVEEVKRAEAGGADYIAASPVFFTSTKRDIGKPLGLEGITAFRIATELPIVAIGGITLANVREVVTAGADSACAISATVGTPDVAWSVREFEARIKKAKEERE